MSNLVVHTTDAHFEQDVLQSDLPVLVDFWAEWCGPCKMIGPIIEAAATEFSGKLKVVKFDVQANPQMSMKYGIRNIPALMIFKNGQVHTTQVGALSKMQLTEFVNKSL